MANFQILKGKLYPDGWTSKDVSIQFGPEPKDRTAKVVVNNPKLGPQYMRNKVSIDIDGHRVFDDILFTGNSVTVAETVPAGLPLLVEISSTAKMIPDPLDERERGVTVRVAEEKIKASPKPKTAK